MTSTAGGDGPEHVDPPDDVAAIWIKIEASRRAALEAEAEADSATTEPKAAKKRWSTVRWLLLDVIATLLWLYALAAVFVGNVDAFLTDRLPGVFGDALRYRTLLIVAVAVMIAIIWRRTVILYLMYVMLFPFVVILWKIPKFYVLHWSWTLVIGTLHVISAVVQSFRWGIIAGGVSFISATIIVVGAPSWMQAVGCTALLTIWLVALVRAFLYAIRPSRFISSQRKVATFVVDSSMVKQTYGIRDYTSTQDEVTLTGDQAKELLTKVSNGLMIHKGLAVLIYQLDRYRQSGAFVAYSALTVLALLMMGVLTFGLVSQGLYNVDPGQFDVEGSPNLVTFTYHAFATITMGQISAVQPAGSIAMILAILAGISAGVLVLVLIVGLTFSIKQSKDDDFAKGAIAALREHHTQLEQALRDEWGISLDEALTRLQRMKWSTGVILWLAKQASPHDDSGSTS